MASPKNNKARGFNFEREIVNRAKAEGLEAVRAWGSNGRSIGEAETVDCKVSGLRIQAKRVKTLAAKYQIPDGADLVVFREDRGETFALIPFEDWLTFVKSTQPTK